jgi:hypothetical protein
MEESQTISGVIRRAGQSQSEWARKALLSAAGSDKARAMSAADASSLSLWSVLSLLGLVLVIIGVVFEGAEAFIWTISWFRRKRFSIIWNTLPEPHIPRWAHRLDHIGWFILVIGLALETWGHIVVTDITSRENRRLTAKLDSTTQIAGAAIASASTNELAAKQLEIQLNETKTQLANAETRLNESVVELQNMNLPMDIGEQYSFANALKPLAGIQVELRSAVDTKAQETSESLFSTFAMAGWPVINRSFIGDIGEEGVVIGHNGDASSKKAAHFLLQLLTDRGVPSEIIDDNNFGSRVRGVPTNSIIVAVCQRPSQLRANLMAVQAKEIALRDQENDQEPKIRARMSEIASEKFVPNSKSLADAQAEYNDLNSRLLKLQYDPRAFFEQERKLDEQEMDLYAKIEKAESGTNSMTTGFHVFNSKFGDSTRFIKAGTNATIYIYDDKTGAPPLQ